MQSEVHLEIFGVWGNRERKYLLTKILNQDQLNLVDYLIDAGYCRPCNTGATIFVFRQTKYMY